MIKTGWLAFCYESDGKFDCIVNNGIYPTKKDCQDAIDEYKKEDVKRNWSYNYSDPKEVGIVEEG